MDTQNSPGEASGSGTGSDSGPGSGSGVTLSLAVRVTRASLERAVTEAMDSKKVKEEIIDNMDAVGSSNDKDDGNNNLMEVGNEDEEEDDEILIVDPDIDLLDSEPELDDSDRSRAAGGLKRGRPGDGPVEPNLGQSYRTIRSARAAASSQTMLNPSPCTVEVGSTGTFAKQGDERILHTNVIHDIKQRVCKSSSYDTSTMMCNTCSPGKHHAFTSRQGGPVAIVASDQSFPACIPATSKDKECIRVMRVEDGSLQEIMYALADGFGNKKLVTGTVIMLGSVTHLARVGTAQYVSDWVRSRWWLRSRLGEDCVVLPAPPVLSGGLEGKSTIRALIETLHWFVSLTATETLLMRGILTHILSTQLQKGVGVLMNDRQTFQVPAGIDTKTHVSLVSVGWGARPGALPPLSKAAESILLKELTKLLNNSFGLGLCEHPLTERLLSDIRGAKLDDYLLKRIVVVGGSHAARLAAALEREGAIVAQITEPGWRITSNAVKSVLEKLTALEPAPDCVIIQALENSAYFCLGEDGTMCLPTRSDVDNRYHVIGELRVATGEQTLALLRLMKPILSALPGSETYVISALPRYAHPDKPCCNAADHLVGRGPALLERILVDLNSMKKNIRSFIYKEKLLRVKVVDPIPLCEATNPDSYADPVHLATAAYGSIAANLLKVMAGVDVGGAELPSMESACKRIRTTPSPRGWGEGSFRGRGQPGRGRPGHRARGMSRGRRGSW